MFSRHFNFAYLHASGGIYPQNCVFLRQNVSYFTVLTGGGGGNKGKNAITERGKCVRDKVTKETILVECCWAVPLIFP